MKIMVFDVPAESGGALTILKLYYNKAIRDIDNKWIFVVSVPNLEEKENVKVIRFPWVKKSWFHRLYFDKFVAQQIAKNEKPDEILSLQNITVHNVKIKQTLYLHQPLPFIEKKFAINENFKFWLLQNVISRIIYKSIKKADRIIVQTNWMKNACLEKVNVSPKKIEVLEPEININVRGKYKLNSDNLFFYPAGKLTYKNHEVIVKAVKELVNKDINNFKVIFTLNGNEANHINYLYEISKSESLPIDFIGSISLEEVYEYYGRSVLVFPSYIETFGLPLLEARMHETPIIASDCAFSHEILDRYEKVNFFDPYDEIALADIMLKYII